MTHRLNVAACALQDEPGDGAPRAMLSAASRRSFTRLILAVMVLAAIVGLAGIGEAPIEGHEIYVVQTAEEMHDHGDWVIPYFSGKLRLNKPPLNYWLTGMVAAADGADEFQAWHGRAVSVFGAMLLVGMTIWCGVQLDGRWTAITAGFLTCACVGYSKFSHDGRPDMLYAGLCTAMIALWLSAWRADSRQAAALRTYAMWVAFGLATLSKGPHIPGVFVLAFAGILWHQERSWRRCAAILRPVSGMALALAIAVPWWVMMYLRIGDGLFGSQLAGRRYDLGLGAILDPYYLYQTLIVILPWCVLWLCAACVLFERTSRGRAARLLLTLVAVHLVALGLASEKRLVYVLPVLGPMMLLMALGARRLTDDAAAQVGLGRRAWVWYLPVYLVVTVAAIIVTWQLHAQRIAEEGLTWIPLVASGVAIVLGLILLRGMALGPRSIVRNMTLAIRGSALIFACFLAAAAATASTCNPSRWVYERLGQAIAARVPRQTVLYSVGISAAPLVYFSDRPIEHINSDRALIETIDAHPQGVHLLITEDFRKRLPARVRVEPLAQLPSEPGQRWDWVLASVPAANAGD